MEEVNNFIINDTLQASQQDFENAKAANGEVNSVKIINNKLSGLNKYGLPISFYDGQKWENIPLKTYQELNASSQELEKNLIKTLPDNIAYVDSNNVLIIEKLSDEHKSTMNFSISGLGSYVSILTGEANQPSVTMRYLETAHRKEYLIDTDVDTPAIKMVIPASDYDKSVWETRTPEKQTQRLVNIKPGSIEESLKDPESTSTELIELTINLGLADYEKNQENIPYTDKLASCFWHMLENSEFVENGRLYFPSLNSSVKFGSQIIVVNGRNPDKKGIIGTYFDNNGVPVINGLPKNMLELTPLNGMFEPAPLNGSEQETQLVIFIADYLSRSRSRSLEVYGALALILQDEFGMTPNRVSGRMPVFENFMKQTATVSTNDNGEEIVVFPFSIYAAEQTDDPSIYGRVERVH